MNVGFGIRTDLYRKKSQREYVNWLAEKKGRDVKRERQDEISRQEGKAIEETMRYFDKRKPKSQAEADYIASKIYRATFKGLK